MVTLDTIADVDDGTVYRVVKLDDAPAAVTTAGTACPSTLYALAIYFPLLG